MFVISKKKNYIITIVTKVGIKGLGKRTNIILNKCLSINK